MGMSEHTDEEIDVNTERFEGYRGNSWFWGELTRDGSGIHLNGEDDEGNVIGVATIELAFIENEGDGPTAQLILHAPDLLAALKQERSRNFEALCWQDQRYAAIRHWIADNHPEVDEAYKGAFYTITDNSFEEIPDDAEYTGCEGYPRYDG